MNAVTSETAKRAKITPPGSQRGIFDDSNNQFDPPKSKLPALQFYVGDWRKDSGVQSCSLAARGLWIEILCIMHESTPRGFLELNGQPISDPQLARLTGASIDELTLLINELGTAGVFSKDSRGVIYSRRMDRDEHIRKIRSEAGKKGAVFGIKGGRPKRGGEGSKTPKRQKGQNNPPSSSSSSSDLKDIRSVDTEKKPGNAKADNPNSLFQGFWEAYPRKLKKDKASKAFAKLSPTPELLARMLSSIENFKRSEDWLKEDGKYIPHPTTWLNDRRWEDEQPGTSNNLQTAPTIKRASDNPETFTKGTNS